VIGTSPLARIRERLPQAPLFKWRSAIESHQDLYLPYGVKDLAGMRQSMITEEVTLKALACALATAGDQASRDQLCEAREARAARLRELSSTAAMIATVGEYYTLRHRSSWAHSPAGSTRPSRDPAPDSDRSAGAGP
jgi:hypothetical protein